MDFGFIKQVFPLYIHAAILTLKIGILGIILAIAVGLVCTLILHKKIPLLRQLVSIYVELSRNTPLLIQLFFIYYGLPKLGIKIDAFVCGVLGLAFLGGSYMCEAFRSGIESIDKIQEESALSLGLSHNQALFYILLPQAVSISTPAFVANIIFLLKETSVFSAISLMDLMFTAKDLIGIYYKTVESLANAVRLLGGLGVALRISLISVFISIPLGILVGILMTFKNPILKAVLRVYLEFIRIMPQLVLLFIVFFGSTRVLGVDISGDLAAVIVFSLWGTAEMGDLVRGAIISIPKHQYESGEALGLSKRQIFIYIIIPQTIKRLVPLSINLITRMIKTTSLVLMIGVVEVIKVAQQIIEANRTSSPNAAFGVYLAVFLMYFIACTPISMLARYLEKRR